MLRDMYNSEWIVVLYEHFSQYTFSSKIWNMIILLKHQKRNPHIKIDVLPYFCNNMGDSNAIITSQEAIMICDLEIIYLVLCQDNVQIESQGFFH